MSAVKGYRPLDPATTRRVNANKEAEERILRVLDTLGLDPQIDPRWLAIGRSHIEQGFMAVNRAIFQPGRVRLEGDPE